MAEENREESTWKIVTSNGYSLILLGGMVAGYNIVQIMLDIKKQGIEWLDTDSGGWWVFYCLGAIFIGQDYLLRKAHDIPRDWKPPHLYRVFGIGAALGWGFHTVLWLLIGR